MEKRCLQCGIAKQDENGIWQCHKYKYKYTVEEACKVSDTCRYYIERIFEDNEPLTPEQHLIMIEQEVQSKHMKGPI